MLGHLSFNEFIKLERSLPLGGGFGVKEKLITTSWSGLVLGNTGSSLGEGSGEPV